MAQKTDVERQMITKSYRISETLNYVIQGHGTLVAEGGEEREVKKGDFALVLPDEKHQYRNKSATEPLIMICAVPKKFE